MCGCVNMQMRQCDNSPSLRAFIEQTLSLPKCSRNGTKQSSLVISAQAEICIIDCFTSFAMTAHKKLLILFSCFVSFGAFAQINNSYISDKIDVFANDSNSVGLAVQAFPYMRNTEYFNDIEKGRTLFGYQFNPAVYLQPNKNVKLQAGVFLRNDYGGNNPYTQALPTFSLKIKSKNIAYTFGTLEGALSHRIIEPMFDINSAITNRIENGFDVRLVSPYTKYPLHSFYNLWINWEKFIERGSPYKEGFTAGTNIDLYDLARRYASIKRFFISPVFQAMMTHRGGQIDTDTLPMTMQFNMAAGLKLPIGIRIRDAIIFESYYLLYQEKSNSGLFPFTQGYGWYHNVSFMKAFNEFSWGYDYYTIMLSYWNGNGFIAPRGTSLYQSVSLDKAGFTQKHRELLFLRLLYKKQLYENLFLDARVEPVYDLRNSILDYSYSLYLTYRQNIGLGKLK